MGNSTGSMFYMFVIIIAVYIVGMLLFQGYQWLKKKLDKRRDQKFQERRDQRG